MVQTTTPTQGVTARNDLVAKLNSYDEGVNLTRTLGSSDANLAVNKIPNYCEDAFATYQTTIGQYAGVLTKDEFKARFNDPAHFTPGQRKNLLLQYFQDKVRQDRSEAVIHFKGNLEAILNDDGNRAGLTALADNEFALGTLDKIAQDASVSGENTADYEKIRADIKEYGRHIGLGKLVKRLGDFKTDVNDDTKRDGFKVKKGADIINLAPEEYREAIIETAVNMAVEDAREKLLAKGYDIKTANALAELDATIAKIDPSIDLIKKATTRLYEEQNKKYASTSTDNLKGRLYEGMKKGITYATKSQNGDLEDEALTLAYSAFSGTNRYLGKGKIS